MLEDRFGLKEEYIRQFFPLDAVLQGLFNLLERLFNVKVRLIKSHCGSQSSHLVE